MRKCLLSGLTILLIMPFIAFAAADDNLLFTTPPSIMSCQGNGTSIWSWTWTNVSNTSQWYSISKSNTCRLGCLNITGNCKADPYDLTNMTVFLMMPIIAFILFYFASLLKEEDWPIHILLLLSGLFFLIIPLGLISEALIGPYNGAYLLMVIIMTVVAFYYILKIIIRAFGMMTKK